VAQTSVCGIELSQTEVWATTRHDNSIAHSQAETLHAEFQPVRLWRYRSPNNFAAGWAFSISVVETKLEKAQFFTRGVPTIADPVVDEKTVRLKTPNDNSDLRRMGSGEVPGDVRVKAGNDQAAQLYFYCVFIKVKNTGPYDFVFSDAGTRKELKRTRFDL